MTTKYIRYFLLSITVVFFTACGSSSSGDSAQEQAIDKIANYAQNGGETPTLQDYIDAGVTGISNVDEINTFVSGLTKEDVDTKEEIQSIVNKLGVSLSPIAKIDVTRTSNTNEPDILFPEGQSIRFSAEGSTDPDGTIVSYVWTEGSKTLANISVFDTANLSVGKHTITLTVTDNDGNSASSELIVKIFESKAEAQTCVQAAGYETVELSNGQIWLDRDLGAVNVGETGTLYYWEDAQNACPCGFALATTNDFSDMDQTNTFLHFPVGGRYYWVLPEGRWLSIQFWIHDGRYSGSSRSTGINSYTPFSIRCIDPNTSTPGTTFP